MHREWQCFQWLIALAVKTDLSGRTVDDVVLEIGSSLGDSS